MYALFTTDALFRQQSHSQPTFLRGVPLVSFLSRQRSRLAILLQTLVYYSFSF